jgi:hypothetical protein
VQILDSIRAFLIVNAARLRMSRFVVLYILSNEETEASSKRSWHVIYFTAAIAYVAMLGLFIYAFHLKDK